MARGLYDELMESAENHLAAVARSGSNVLAYVGGIYIAAGLFKAAARAAKPYDDVAASEAMAKYNEQVARANSLLNELGVR